MNESKVPLSLPEFFRPLFWSYDFHQINPQKDERLIITQAINYGDLTHWKWIRETYGLQEIQRILSLPPQTAFRTRALALAAAVFNIDAAPHAS